MKRKFVFSLVATLILAFSFPAAIAQEKNSKKEQKETIRIEKEKQIALLINSKQFVFLADEVTSQSRMINLTDNYFVEFRQDSIKSDLPFFGTRHGGGTYGSTEGGIKFNNKSEKYSLEKTKKNYEIVAVVKEDGDSYSLFLSVSFEGSAYLTINSSYRSSISYNGYIKPLENK